VGVYEGAVDSAERFASLAASFPAAEFTLIGPDTSDTGRFDVLIIAIMIEKAPAAAAWLQALPATTKAIVVLHGADLATSRQLVRDGAAEVVPGPATETALALALERLLSAPAGKPAGGGDDGSQVVALLKAAGGVGATSLGVQSAVILAGRDGGQVVYADLDIQNGAAAAYLDLPDSINVLHTLSAGDSLSETPFASALAKHRSGLKLLAAPQEIVSLDAVRASHIGGLMSGLRRNSALTIIDLPSASTSWTTEVLSQADQIAVVTQLTVPHVQMMKRQLNMLAAHNIKARQILVLNAVSRDQQASLTVKAAERALGRSFDVVIPYDARTMAAAIDQGVELATVRRGTGLEKAIAKFADRIGVAAPAKAKRD
jgi:pilus assembly protein CpaE